MRIRADMAAPPPIAASEALGILRCSWRPRTANSAALNHAAATHLTGNG